MNTDPDLNICQHKEQHGTRTFQCRETADILVWEVHKGRYLPLCYKHEYEYRKAHYRPSGRESEAVQP